MKTEAFQNWITAEAILNIIAPKVRAYVSRADDCISEGTIEIKLIPPQVFGLIPPENVGEFEQRYNRFAEWVGDSLGLFDYIEKYANSPMGEELYQTIEFDVNTKIDEYNSTHCPTITEKFMEFMTDKKPGDVEFVIKY